MNKPTKLVQAAGQAQCDEPHTKIFKLNEIELQIYQTTVDAHHNISDREASFTPPLLLLLLFRTRVDQISGETQKQGGRVRY